MSTWTEDLNKRKKIEDYFSSFNSLAKKIVELKAEAVRSHSVEEWSRFSQEEKDAAITDYFVTPKVKKRYKNKTSNFHLPEHCTQVFPKLKVKTGQEAKYSTDDGDMCFIDEHSAPFSWETVSQMNLKVPDFKCKVIKSHIQDELSEKWENFDKKILKPLNKPIVFSESKSQSPMITTKRQVSEESVENDGVSIEMHNYDDQDKVESVSKNSTSPNPQKNMAGISNSINNVGSDEDYPLLPRTSIFDDSKPSTTKSGFDFLDNW